LKELLKSGYVAVDLATAFDASPNAYVLLTPDLRIAGVNQAYLDITHSSREEINGQPLFGAFDSGPSQDGAENVRQVAASLEKAIATKARDHLAVVKFHIERQRPDGAVFYDERYWSATHTPILDDEGEVIYVLQHTSDITELERLRRGGEGATPTALDGVLGGDVMRRANLVQQDNLRLESERRRLVDLIMQTPGFVALLAGPDHVFEMHNEAYGQLVGHRSLLGKPMRDALPEIGETYFDLLDSVFETGETYEGRASRIQLQRQPNGEAEEAFLNFTYQPVRDSSGQTVGVFVQGYEVTENVLSAQRQKLMIDELNHRVKNTLATVQSIAIQSARSHADPRTFATEFQSRLMALSHTHDLLTRSHWEGADLRDVLHHETEAHDLRRINMNGPLVALTPATALSLGMIFHELATNAAKHGALSRAEGRIFIDWTVTEAEPRLLNISWSEVGGPEITAPEHRGFGSRLIERNVRHDMAGDLKLGYPSTGLHAELVIPLDRGQTS